MFFRQLYNDETACASYVLGCKTHGTFAVIEPHQALVEDYLAVAAAQGVQITAILDTHLQADHVSGMGALLARTSATAYLPEGSGAQFEHHPLADGEVVTLGNTAIQAIATPGHAPAHHAYLVTDHSRCDEPWLVLTGDALLVGDAGRPDLHAQGEHSVEEMARLLYRSLNQRLLSLPDHVLVYPSHYSGSVCGRGLSANPASTIGFERRHNRALGVGSEAEFVEALRCDAPPAPPRQAEILAANRSGSASAATP
jgi:glyoxylase-like metal-dependent hydrolase (beta-lactamase superfamily II)